MTNTELKILLDKIYSVSTDEHSIYTPLDLCEEMINSISNLTENILVISNLEFLIVLKQKGIDMSLVYYSTACELKKRVAITLGININNIVKLQYNKEVEIDIDMKFDIVIQNPPYNPNALWKKFVEKGIDMLKDDGQMVAIHPSDWRESTKHNKLCEHFKEHISELHINDYEIWKDQKVAIKTDWYLYKKNKINETVITYSNGNSEILNLKQCNKILRFLNTSSAFKILSKILDNNHNSNIIMQGRTGYHPLYKKHDSLNGLYKQCGTESRGNNWTKNDYSLTIEPNENQFQNKVAIAYSGKPRAKYFSKEDEIGIIRANYWLTDNQSLPILLNSKMFWKLCCKIVDPDKGQYKPYGTMSGIPSWILKHLNFDGLIAKTDEELYKHYKLTQEEINWIEEK